MRAMNPESIITHVLEEADGLLLGLFSNALIGVYVIQDGRFVFVNHRLAELFGYTQAELCAGLGPMDLTAPENQPRAQQEIDRRIRGDVKASYYGFRGVRKDGSQLDVEVFGVATSYRGQPAIIGMLLDVTLRCTAERAVADQLGFIGQLIDTIPNPVFYKDEHGIYLGCNAAFESYIGIERDRLVGCSVYDISPPDLAEKYAAADQRLFDTPGTQVYEANVLYADGQRHDVVFYKATFNKSDGSLGGLVGVMLDITDRKRMEQAIWHEANYDALTGLPNRRLFRDRLHQEVERAKRNARLLAVLFIDLDRFKEVNDTLGHEVGDQLLCEAGQRIRAELRASDTLTRQGGDEFMVILPDLTHPSQAGRVAQEIIHALSGPFLLKEQQAYVSASIGIAFYPDDSTDLEQLVSYADQAMYAAKAAGRNCFCHFTATMQEKAMYRLSLGNDLRSALVKGELDVYYQPIIDLLTGRVTKAEALVRWRHPVRGMISPAEFIPVAEELGLIGDIGNWVFREAVQALIKWRTLAGDSVQMAVNKSPRQFIADHCCHDWVDYLRRHEVPPQMVAVEITEGLLLDQRPVVVETLLAFRDAGVQVSIDDFGTGYSAMSYLKKFDVDYLKIDRSFIHDLTTDPCDLAIAEAIIVMAHKLKLKVVAEGVESAEQAQLLQEAGCDYVQGFYYAKPMPWAEFWAYVTAN